MTATKYDDSLVVCREQEGKLRPCLHYAAAICIQARSQHDFVRRPLEEAWERGVAPKCQMDGCGTPCVYEAAGTLVMMHEI